MSETTRTITKEPEIARVNGGGPHQLVPTDELAVAKLVTNEQLAGEKRSLQKVETAVEHKYRGIRGYWRIFQVTRVIALLSPYVYLDQLDLHQSHEEKHRPKRFETARPITRPAVYWENI